MSATATVVRRILIVEDDELMSLVYRGMFRRLTGEFSATLAADAASALTLLAENRFDAVVLDWDLPDADGLSLLEPSHERGARVLIASGRAQDADRELALSRGADDYLTKPFSSETFVAGLRRLLSA